MDLEAVLAAIAAWGKALGGEGTQAVAKRLADAFVEETGISIDQLIRNQATIPDPVKPAPKE